MQTKSKYVQGGTKNVQKVPKIQLMERPNAIFFQSNLLKEKHNIYYNNTRHCLINYSTNFIDSYTHFDNLCLCKNIHFEIAIVFVLKMNEGSSKYYSSHNIKMYMNLI